MLHRLSAAQNRADRLVSRLHSNLLKLCVGVFSVVLYGTTQLLCFASRRLGNRRTS